MRPRLSATSTAPCSSEKDSAHLGDARVRLEGRCVEPLEDGQLLLGTHGVPAQREGVALGAASLKTWKLWGAARAGPSAMAAAVRAALRIASSVSSSV